MRPAGSSAVCSTTTSAAPQTDGEANRARVRLKAHSSPGELVLWKAAAWIEDLDPMWRPIAPSPQNEVVVLGCRTRGEARHEDASLAFAMEPPGDVPRRRLLSLRQQAEPWTGHVLEAYTMLRPNFWGPKVRNVVTSDIVGAQHARLDLVCEPLVCLLDRRHHAERHVKRRHASRVEAGAADCRALTGEWFERPSWIVRPIARPIKPHANPPRARWSR
jgi:hypothetical protein